MPISTTLDPAMQQAIMAQMAARGKDQPQAMNVLPPTPLAANGGVPLPAAAGAPTPGIQAPADMPMPGPAPAAPMAQAAAPAASAASPRTYDWSPGGKDSNEERAALGLTPLMSANGNGWAANGALVRTPFGYEAPAPRNLPGTDLNSPGAIADRKAEMQRLDQLRSQGGLPTSGQQPDGSWNMRIESGGQPARVVNSLGRSPSVGVQQGGQPVGVGPATANAAVPPASQLMGTPPSAAPGGSSPSGPTPLTDYKSFMNDPQNAAMYLSRNNKALGLDQDAPAGSYKNQWIPSSGAPMDTGHYQQMTNTVDPESGRADFNQQMAQQMEQQNEATLRRLNAGAGGGLGGATGAAFLKQSGDNRALAMQNIQRTQESLHQQGLPPMTPDEIKSTMDSMTGATASPTTVAPAQAGPTPAPGDAPPPKVPTPTRTGWTQDQQKSFEAASQAKGFSPEGIADWMRGQTTLTSPQDFKDIASKLGKAGIPDVEQSVLKEMVREAGQKQGYAADPWFDTKLPSTDLGGGMKLEQEGNNFVMTMPNGEKVPIHGGMGGASADAGGHWPGTWDEVKRVGGERLGKMSALYRAMHGQQ